MPLRFHRSFRLIPGLRFNISKTGPSLSVGHPGATINLRGNRARATVGIPGSGLSYVQTGRMTGWVIVLALLVLVFVLLA